MLSISAATSIQSLRHYSTYVFAGRLPQDRALFNLWFGCVAGYSYSLLRCSSAYFDKNAELHSWKPLHLQERPNSCNANLYKGGMDNATCLVHMVKAPEIIGP